MDNLFAQALQELGIDSSANWEELVHLQNTVLASLQESHRRPASLTLRGTPGSTGSDSGRQSAKRECLTSRSHTEYNALPSIGATLFGGTPAPGFTTPIDDLPGPWKVQFAKYHLSAAVYAGVFTTCRAGRDWSLRSAPTARLLLDCNKAPAGAPWLRQLGATGQALVTRGGRPTVVSVLCDGSQAADSCFVDIPSHLRSTAQHITNVQLTAASDPTVVTCWLIEFASYCSNLAALQLQIPPALLPLPNQLRNLRDLSLVSDPSAATHPQLVTSLGRLLKQLTSLKLHAGDLTAGPQQQGFFTAATKTTTLTSLDLGETTLTGPLLRALVDHVPALKRLKAGVYRVATNCVMGRQWGVESLDVLQMLLSASYLIALPLSTVQTVINIRASHITLYAESVQGFDTRLATRFKEWQIDIPKILICPLPTLPLPDQPLALRATLQQLATLHTAPHTEVRLHGWQWTPTLTANATNDLVPITHLRFGAGFDGPLTDAVLGVARHMRVMEVSSLELQRDHSEQVWPWDEVSVHSELRVSDLAKMPRIQGGSGEGGRHVIRAPEVDLASASEMFQVDLMSLFDMLQHLRWAPTTPSDPKEPYTLTFSLLTGMGDTNNYLQTQLRVLQAIRLHNPTETQTPTQMNVHITGALMDASTFDKIRKHAPVWDGAADVSLTLSECFWRSGVESVVVDIYEQQGEKVPTLYSKWVLKGVPQFVTVKALCEGANRARVGLGLPVLEVVSDSVKSKEDEIVWEHVRLVRPTGQTL